MFTLAQRSSFKYWMAHNFAYQMTALNLGIWKPRYILHDAEKPWLMLWAKLVRKDNPYKWVQQWHRHHNRHHLECKTFNAIEAVIDWECSRYTKESSPETSFEYFLSHRHKMTPAQQVAVQNALMDLGLWKGSYR